MICTAAVAVIRPSNGRTAGLTPVALAIPLGQAQKPSRYLLTPSRAARITLIGMSCNSYGPVRFLPTFSSLSTAIARTVIDNCPEDLHPDPRDLRTAHERHPGGNRSFLGHYTLLRCSIAANMLHWHLRAKSDLALSKRPQGEAELGAGRTVGEKQCGAIGRPPRSVSSTGFFRRCTMATETAASAVGVVTALRRASAEWPDELWAMSVSLFIRTCYGVYEFTDDPSCVLRVGLSPARATISLSDGTRIEMGQMVGTLHFWNEHLPRYTIRGPDLRWACVVRNRVLHSFHALALYVESEPAWRQI